MSTHETIMHPWFIWLYFALDIVCQNYFTNIVSPLFSIMTTAQKCGIKLMSHNNIKIQTILIIGNGAMSGMGESSNQISSINFI